MRLGEYPPISPPAPSDAWPKSIEAPGGNRSKIPRGFSSPAGKRLEDRNRDEHAEIDALAALGFSKPLIALLAAQARKTGATIETELLRSGEVDEATYYAALARFLRLPFVESIDPASINDMPLLDTQLQRPTMLRINRRYRPPQIAVVPEAGRLCDITAVLTNMPHLDRDLAITTPSAIRQAVWRAGACRRQSEAVKGLFDRHPRFSARTVLSGSQGFWMGLALAALLSALIVRPLDTLALAHVFMSLIYFITLTLRFLALTRQRLYKPVTGVTPPAQGPLPAYTVMVALYKEASVVGQLANSLRRLDWPAHLLDIKLICEADDRETILALKALDLDQRFEIVEVPVSEPRTKPKALTYALAAARGEFVAIYDAEDRPHPRQLREAHRQFRFASDRLACLQAPLVITNASQCWISALFSLEYSGLFRGLLPMLARHGMPLPLGGTSNHFRTAVLRQAGGWDPFNVTEDADLGLRLYRLGYRSDVIVRQTLEDAPTTVKVWMNQRSRWFKGWLQTWLVLMRAPGKLAGEMGLKAFCVFQLTIGGMLASSLLHPLIVVFVGVTAWSMLNPPAEGLDIHVILLFVIDCINIFGSYLIFVLLGMTAMIPLEQRLIGRRWAAVPLYWLMMSAAAWRAAIELRSRPFFWNKTPHEPIHPTGRKPGQGKQRDE